MLRSLITLYISFLLLLPAYGQQNRLDNALLWEITGQDLKEPSYLFGTIHLIPVKDYFFTKKMKELLKSCRTLALEIDLKIPFMEKIAIAGNMFLPYGTTLRKYLSSADYNKFRSYIVDSLELKESKMKRYDKLKPFYSYSLILKQKIGRVKLYEKELYKLAKRKNLRIMGLETIQYQMSLIDDIEIEEQLDVLMDLSHSHKNSLLDEYFGLLRVYKEQDITAIYEFSKEEEGLSDFEAIFLTKRNQNWIPVIEKLISSEKAFIAVGAAHLGGEAGLIRLLRQKGYELKPVEL